MREGQTFEGRSRLVLYANFVKLPHTIFALPFALVGATLATYRVMPTVAQLGWIVLAFTAARFAAMGFNRIVDRDVDALNPRTKMRELPSGALGVREASATVAVACVLFVVAAWRLNPLCFALSPVALACVLFYSYCKRFTRWSHLVLGLGLSIAPVGGYLALTGRWSEPWWLLCALALAVITWSGGFDILYALQDEAFDRAHGLHSLPSALGVPRALALSRLLHVGTVAFLTLAGVGAHATWIWFAGVGVVAALLLYEHSLVEEGDLSKLDAAFFTMNGVISMVFLAFVVTERLVVA